MLVNIYSPDTLSNPNPFQFFNLLPLIFYSNIHAIPIFNCINPTILFTNIPTYIHFLFTFYSFLSFNFYWSISAAPNQGKSNNTSKDG